MKQVGTCLAIAAAVMAAGVTAPSSADAHTLGWSEAKRAAKRIADDFPIYPDRIKVDWCNRWSKHEVHCGVTGTVTEYDPDLEEMVEGDTCSDTAIVKKRNGTNRKTVRSDGSLSCFYY
jgi:hypothetical protein